MRRTRLDGDVPPEQALVCISCDDYLTWKKGLDGDPINTPAQGIHVSSGRWPVLRVSPLSLLPLSQKMLAPHLSWSSFLD